MEGTLTDMAGVNRDNHRGLDFRSLFVADAFALQGQGIRVEMRWLKWTVPGRSILLSYRRGNGWMPLGRATIDSHRRAAVEGMIPEPGYHRVGIQAEGEESIVETSTAMVVPAGNPLLVTDIDRTISDAYSWRANIGRPERIRPLPGAVDVLRSLAGRFSLVYVTARNWRFSMRTHRWLDHCQFPPGPVFFRPRWGVVLPAGRFKQELLQRWLKGWSGFGIGIGDRLSDARAYASAGMLPIAIRGSLSKRFPPETRCARNWKGVLEIVNGTVDLTKDR
jgi:hypothetical protein